MRAFIKLLLFLTLVFFSTHLQAKLNLEKAKKFVKDHPNKIAASLIELIDDNVKTEAIEYLIEQRADVNAMDKDGRTAFHYLLIFARPNNQEELENLLNNFKALKKAGVDVNARDEAKLTAFDYALYTGNIENMVFFQRLLDVGVDDVNLKDKLKSRALFWNLWRNLIFPSFLLEKEEVYGQITSEYPKGEVKKSGKKVKRKMVKTSKKKGSCSNAF